MSTRHGTTKERGTKLGAVHLLMNKQIGLTGSNLHPSYIHTNKYCMLLPASPTPLTHNTVPLLPRPSVNLKGSRFCLFGKLQIANRPRVREILQHSPSLHLYIKKRY